MKKKLFLRLCLMLLVGVSAFSCRTEDFHNEEEAHGITQFRLTTQRISLSEAKHKAKLLTELKEAEEKFKAFSKTSNQGKIIHYANGVSIDTDQVTYIENGPNFHTYTFHLSRQNALPTDPVENLVLIPTTDGTYKELLVSYALSVTEKETLKNGGFVDTKGKMSITELASGTYNPLSKGMTACGWQEENTFVTVCSENQHGMWNTESWGSCSADRKPGWHTTMVYKCDFIYTGNETGGTGWWAGSGGGTDNGGGGEPCPTCPTDPTQQPCNGNGVSTGLIDPNTNIGEGGCAGIPTVIEFPNPDETPCAKIKAQRADPEFTNRITDLKGKTGLKKETGYSQKANGNFTYHDNATATDVANALTPPDLDDPLNSDVIAMIHTHVNDYSYGNPNGPGVFYHNGIKIFSPADIAYFLELVKNAHAAGKALSDVYMVMVSSKGNYQIRFTGNQYQIKTFTDLQTEAHREPFKDYMKRNGMTKSKDLEFNMLKYLDGKMNVKGITLYRMNADGSNTEIKLNATKTDIEENECPSKI
ncbi:hypothetical protein [Chryseobacterium taihuense]|uniref:Uncharacterized protein n=1 Tax=Chryseobacterium taihuense TaxID=1141221 RepID=A0ABY0QS02_9FLAO|nr:hypothetical protein [Chryseobacterium taihuense]SDL68173.1 hypothetical protein SAMN05216273_104163 [Chryseobacterium taihuense]